MAKTTSEISKRQAMRVRRHNRVRRRVAGSAERPRLTVFRSNKGIYAQVIDDLEGKTLVSASSSEIKESNLSRMDQAKKVGEMIAGKAKEKNIEQVVFDRGSYLYHGRIRALAEGAREGGIQF